MWAALQRGGVEYLGWGVAEYILAAGVDATNLNTAVTQVAGTKKKPRVPKPMYRPGKDSNKVREIRPKRIREMKNIQLRS